MLAFVEGFGIKYEALRQAARVQRMYQREKQTKGESVKRDGAGGGVGILLFDH